jgi:hypothetical protein
MTPLSSALLAENIKSGTTIFNVVGTYGGSVPRTGQTICYNATGGVISCAETGQDGDTLKGVTWPRPRFTSNSDNTVTDNLTGLMWAKNANSAGSPKTWTEALTYCNDLTIDTYTDWRLPNRFELESLLDLAYSNPALSNDAGTGQWNGLAGSSFTGVQLDYYWSSTTGADLTSRALRVGLYPGDVGRGDKGSTNSVWPVRGGQ